MEITRKVEFSIATNRRYVIRESEGLSRPTCFVCGEPMLTTEQAARLFGITQRRIFRMIELDAVHATELASGAVLICLASLSQTVDRESHAE